MSEEKFVQAQEQEGTEAFEGMSFDKKELYKQLRLMGYDYGGLFKGITKRSKTGRQKYLPNSLNSFTRFFNR
jgi:hypothetical protein